MGKLRENFKKGKILEKMLGKSDVNYKHLFFQVIHTLAVIQKEHPTFIHNNLNLKNILVYQINERVNLKYKFDNDYFEIPDLKIEIKFFNFSESESADFPGKSKTKDYYHDLF